MDVDKRSEQQWNGLPGVFRGSGEFFPHCDTRAMSSRPCRMVAVLLVREYIGKHLSAAWIFALVSDYAPRSWRVKCIQVTLGEKV
jgi:hypothetical protein